MREEARGSGLWRDASELPATLASTIERSDGFEEVTSLLGRPACRRVVVTGNGGSYYVAHALWLAALADPAPPVELVAVPGGLVARGGFRWREGDVLLAISSSGEFRDVVEAIEDRAAPRPFALVTAEPDSTLGQAAGARALVEVQHQRGLTHTQAFCGAVLTVLALWAELADDVGLLRAVRDAPGAVERALGEAELWVDDALDRDLGPSAGAALGSGPAWAAALEAALLVKEIARIPFEGVETREGATSVMTALARGHLVLTLGPRPDPLLDESEELAASCGSAVARAPAAASDPRLAAVTTFPAALALALELALRAGLDPDRPAWADAYYATARRPE